MVTEAQLQAWEALAEAATAGPWTVRYRDIVLTNESLLICAEVHADDVYVTLTENDSAFIAAARTALPTLIASHRTLAARLGDAEGNLNRYGRHLSGCLQTHSIPPVGWCSCGLAAALSTKGAVDEASN